MLVRRILNKPASELLFDDLVELGLARSLVLAGTHHATAGLDAVLQMALEARNDVLRAPAELFVNPQAQVGVVGSAILR
jgi:hypothetical protein